MGRAQKKEERYAGIFADRFDELLKDKCKKEKRTNGQIARELGVAPASLTHWCSGEKFPSGDKLVKIALYFGVSIDWLVGFSGSRSPKEDMTNACAMTGLSSKTVGSIREFIKNNTNTNGAFLLERLFCNSDFVQLLSDLGDVFDAHLLCELRESAMAMLETESSTDEELLRDEAKIVVSKLAFDDQFINSAGIKRQHFIEFALCNINDPQWQEEMGGYRKIASIDIAKSAAIGSFFQLLNSMKFDRPIHKEIDRMRRIVLSVNEE